MNLRLAPLDDARALVQLDQLSIVEAESRNWSLSHRRACKDGVLLPMMASILPESLEPIRSESRVAYGRGNRPVAKVVLDRPGILPVIGQLVAG
jgi:hypothetical protein